MRIHRRGQSILEYSILLIIIIAAFITMQIYIKRGFQGRWKSAVDELGDQYDPYKSNTTVTWKMQSSSETRIKAIYDMAGATPGYVTLRSDNALMSEQKQGMLRIQY
jgi:uncharacterized protein (UPF0333 family)